MSKKKAEKQPARSSDMQGNNRDVGYGRPPLHTRFKKGQSGNPKGRPRSAVNSDAFRAALAQAPPRGQDADVRSHADAIARALIERALKGDLAAVKEIANRTEGRPRRAVPLSHTERERLRVAVRAIMGECGCTREEAVRTLGLSRREAFDLLGEG